VIPPIVSSGDNPVDDGVNTGVLGWMEETLLGRFNEKAIMIGVSRSLQA
jgi:hypothetical protein